MVTARTVLIEFIDCDTGEIIRQYPFSVTGEDNECLFILLNVRKLGSFLSSFIRGCYKCDHLELRMRYNKNVIL